MISKGRNSNIEILRLLCMFGIVSMHVFSQFCQTVTGVNFVFGTLLNSVFNSCVSIFILISGYYSIHFSVQKILKMEFMVLFYSIINLIVMNFILNEPISYYFLITSVFPSATKKYWFVSVYMILMIVSPWVNKALNNMTKIEYKRLIVTLLIVFCIVPTFIYYEITNDHGKGIVNMLLVYMIGRYIRVFEKDIEKIKTKRIVITLIFTILIAFGGGLVLGYIRGGIGLCSVLVRDNSILVLIESVSVFVIFLRLKYMSNKHINRILEGVFGIYLLEGTVRSVVDASIFNWAVLENKWYLFGILILYVLIIMGICLLIELIRQITLGRVESKFSTYIERKIKSLANRYHI